MSAVLTETQFGESTYPKQLYCLKAWTKYKLEKIPQIEILKSDWPSNHISIPSPQCALGTTPHLSIRKKAKEGKKTEEKKKGAGRKYFQEKTAEDVKNDGK